MGAYQEFQDDLRQFDLLDGKDEKEDVFQRFICGKIDEHEARIAILEGMINP